MCRRSSAGGGVQADRREGGPVLPIKSSSLQEPSCTAVRFALQSPRLPITFLQPTHIYTGVLCHLNYIAVTHIQIHRCVMSGWADNLTTTSLSCWNTSQQPHFLAGNLTITSPACTGHNRHVHLVFSRSATERQKATLIKSLPYREGCLQQHGSIHTLESVTCSNMSASIH